MKNKPYLKTRLRYFLYSIVLVSFAVCGAQPALSRWISGGSVPEVKCVDLLNGGVQTLNVESAEGGFLVRGLVMRDYPLVFCYSLP